jgi:hypothetical protein
VIVQVPDFGDRFFTYQVVDAQTDSFYAGRYLPVRVRPHQQKEPRLSCYAASDSAVTAVYRLPTDLCTVFPRAFQDDTPEDKAAIQPLLSQIMSRRLVDTAKGRAGEMTSAGLFTIDGSEGCPACARGNRFSSDYVTS